MSYIGSSAAVVPVAFSGVNSQSFNGDGSTVAFTLNRPVSSVKAIEVVVNNVQQSPYDSSYSVSNTTLTFSAAPSSGTANIYVTYLDFPVGSITDPNAVAKAGDTMTGALTVTVAGNTETLNRTGSDGVIQTLQKDGTTVGSIGSGNTGRLQIGSGDTGIMFDAINNAIYPWDISTNTLPPSDQVDLGYNATGLRFKDLYLSGGVYLGGTGAANKLDDYEEGTWTPTDASGAGLSITVNASGTRNRYTKIGNLVYLTASLQYPATSDTSVARLTLPFAQLIPSYYSGGGYVTYATRIPANQYFVTTENSTAGGGSQTFLFYDGGSTLSNANLSSQRIDIQIQYLAA